MALIEIDGLPKLNMDGHVSHNQMVSKFSGDAVIFFDGSTGFRHLDNNIWDLLGFKHPKIRFPQQKKG